LVVLAGVVSIWPAYAQAQQSRRNACVECHSQLGDKLGAPVSQLPESVHGKAGLSCADCHGGDPTADDMDAAMSPMEGYRGAPEPAEVPRFCGRCHSDERYMRRYRPRIPVDQEKAYWTSMHGTLLKRGDTKVAQCVSCHGSHEIRAVNDPRSTVYPTRVPLTCKKCHANSEYMAEYGIPTDQFEKYKKSVHGIALLEKGDTGAPACNDCHGNHGAVPPGVASVANVCGHCHVSPRELFVASPHKKAFDDMGLSECIVCHGNHEVKRPSDEMLGVEEQATCAECHGEGDPGYLAAKSMKEAIVTLAARIDSTRELIARASEAGMEMSDEELELREAENRLVMARNLVHTLDPDTLASVTKEGRRIVSGVQEAGFAALHELSVRRIGLAVSALIIVLLILALYMTLREIEGRGAAR